MLYAETGAARVLAADGKVTFHVDGLTVVAGLAQRDTEPRLHSASNVPSKLLLIVFPGFAMPGRLVFESLFPWLRPGDALTVVEYPQRLDMSSICQLLLGVIDDVRPQRLGIYGASMGGMCAVDFLSRYQRHDTATLARQSTVVLDTAPSRAADLRFPFSLPLPSWYQGGPIGGLAWRIGCRFYRFAPVEPDADPEIVARAHRAFATMGMPTLTSQKAYVSRFVAPKEVAARRVVFARGRPAGGDPLIMISRAIDGWRHIFPDLEVMQYDLRDDRWHVPIPERPRETMQLLYRAL